MRISNHQNSAIMLDSLNRNAVGLSEMMQKMSSSKRILTPSDDPIASVRLLRIQRTEASLNQYEKNITNVSGNLSIQEANLTSTSDTMLQIHDLLLWAANGSNTAEDLNAMSGELSSLEDTILSFLNVRDEEGRYLFSGTMTDTKAVEFDGTEYSFAGNDKTRQAAVANGVMVEENIAISSVFDIDFLNNLHALVGTLQDENLDVTDPATGQAIRDVINQLDVTHGNILSSITELGGRQNTLKLLNTSNEDVSLVNQKIEGDLSELDYAGATIDLQNYKLALQATQKTYLTVNDLSLFKLL